MAEAFGRQLIDEIEVVGFDEILTKLRSDRTSSPTWFNCVQIDNILRTVRRHDFTASATRPPIVEITSIAPQGGKTHLLYLLTSIAVTPSSYGGREACVAIVDSDRSFDVPRLVQQIRLRLESRTHELSSTALDELVHSALDHVYILKLESMDTLSATVASLEEWFLSQQHRSLDRPMAFFAIDSITTAQLQTASSDTFSEDPSKSLSAAIVSSSRALQCPAILTTRYQGHLSSSSDKVMPRTLRPDHLLSPLADLQLLVRRVPVRNIPSSLSEEEAARETVERMKIVALGRFECVVNERGLNARTVQALRDSEDGFYFRIKQEGLTMESSSPSSSLSSSPPPPPAAAT